MTAIVQTRGGQEMAPYLSPAGLATGRIEMDVLALTPLHHGAGVQGNTQLLRRETVITPEGHVRRVPFISGNALKHKLIREPGALYALERMGVERGALDKRVVDLLFSGGHLSSTGAKAVRLDRARELAELFPVLALCGYGAGNQMEASRISVDHLTLVCRENQHRLSPGPAALPHALLPQAQLREEHFGTRHEATRIPQIRQLLGEAEQAALAEAVSERKGKEETQSSQMIFDFEVIVPGSRLVGGVHFRALSEMELAALESCLSYGCEGRTEEGRLIYRIGAKGATGYGRVGIRFNTHLKIAPAPAAPVHGAVDPRPREESRLERYDAHLQQNATRIVELLTEVAK